MLNNYRSINPDGLFLRRKASRLWNLVFGLLLLLASASKNFAQTAFTGGNLVVVRVGSGAAALGTGATQVAVSEYNTAGSAIQTLTFQSSTTIPAAGSAPFLNLSGSTANEGFGSTSIDGSFFPLFGYNLTNGTASVNGAASNNLRAIGRANANGTLSIPQSALAYNNANTVRGIVSDGTNFWVSCNNGVAGSGIAYISGSTVTNLLGVNSRCVGIFNGQLFYSTGSGTQGVYPLGTGLPTSAATAGTVVAATNPNQFSFNPTHDICYIADEGTAANGGGVRKLTRSGSTWTQQYVLNNNGTTTTAARGLVVDWSGASPVIYFTEATASANRIMRITDNGSALSTTNTAGTAPTQIVAGATNIRLAGIGFAPRTPSIILSGTGSVAPHSRAADNYTEGFGPIATATSSFVVNGTNLGGNITVTAPANFQVSTSASSGFGSSVTLPPTSGSVSNQTVFVRMSGGLAIGSYSGNVTVTATGCPQPGAVAVSGTVNSPTPSITAPASLPVSLSGFVTTAGTASAVQTITLTAANLTSALTITASSGFEISSGGAYASSLNLGTSISGLVINVRVAASATTATTSGTITTSSSDAPVNGLTLANLSATVYSGQFTAGNIAVQVLGDGVSGLSSAASQVNVWELNSSTGALTNPFVLPRAASLPSSAPFNVTESGSATSGGQMVRASNGAFLSVSGYNATVGTGAVVSTTTPGNKRVLARLGQNGTTTTTAYDFFSGNNFRSTASNGYSYWCAGTVNSGVGLYYLKDASSTPTSLGSINTRVVQVYNNNLYFSSASTGGIGVYQAGTNGLPVRASDAAVTRLTDNTYATTAGGSPYSFTINPAGDVLYIADDATFVNTSTQRGGIIKYTKSGSTWSYQYTLQVSTSITNGARGLAVDWSGTNPVLYITSANGTQIYKLTDNGVGASGTGTQLGVNAPSGYVFRALQFAPVPQPTELSCTANLLDFVGQPPAGVSAEKVFNVAGSGFTGNITVSVPSTSPAGQYGISFTSGGPYSTSLTITGSGSPNAGNATVYMVFKPTTVGVYDGNLSISASGATTVNVPVIGSCVNPVNYYNVSGADVTNPNNWGTNTDGTGTKPVNFTDNGQYFNIVNTPGALGSMQTTAVLSPTASTTSASAILTFSNPPSCPNSPVSFFVGATITGAGIPAGTTILDVTGNVITMSAAATATASGITVSVPVAAGWSISGVISKLIIGDGTNARSFTIPSTHAYNGTVDVKNLGTLILQNSIIPTLGNLDVNSTVNYNHSGAVTIVLPSANGPYGNLILQGTAAATDIRNLPASSPLTLPFQVLGNFTADNVTVLGATGAPFTYMGLQGNLTGANGALFGGNPPASTNAIASIVTIGDGNQTLSYPGGVIGSFIFSSTKSAGTLTLGSNTTLLTYGQSGTFTGTQLIFSGTAAFVSNAGSTLATTGNANVDVSCTGTASFTLGGNIDATNNGSTLFSTPVSVNSSVYFNMAAGTSFADGGNTITVSNNFGTNGSKAAYNFTGTVEMAPASGTVRIQNNNTLQGLFVADLNNLKILPSSTAGNIIVQPLSGFNVLTVKGDFTVGGTATGSKFQPNSNIIQIGGNYSNSRTIDMISAGASTFEFNGTSAQTFSTAYASGESFFNLKLNNAAGLTLTSGNIRVSGNLNCQDGLLSTGSNKAILNPTATITEAVSPESYVDGNLESTRTLNTGINQTFGGMGIEINALGAAPGSTVVTRITGSAGNAAIGCNGQSNRRSFTVVPTVNTGLNASVKYLWSGGTTELNGLDENLFNLFTGGGPWTLINPNAVANAAGNFITVTGQDGLGSYVASTPQPSLGSITQNAICAGNVASIDLTGLLASAEYTINYTINGVAQAPVTAVTSNASGNATFSSASLTSASNGQTLAITSLVRTDVTPNCTATFSSGNSVILTVNPEPSLSSTAQTGVACENSNALIALTGLVPSSTATFTYSINGGPAQTLTGISANGSGAATLNVPVVLSDDAQTLEITQIQITSSSPNCSKAFSSNNSVVLSVKPRPTASISANDFVCEGQTAPVDIYFTGTAPFNLQYNINATPQTAVNTSANPYSMPYTNATVARTYSITSLTDANGCAATVLENLTIDVPIPCFVTWNGSVSSDWNNKDNWTPNNSAPSIKTSVVFKSAPNQPNISSASPAANCASVTFQNGAAPSVAAGFSLSVRGDLSGIAGNTFSGDGKVVLNGTGTQTISGRVQLGNVDFANNSPGGVVVQAGSSFEIAPGATASFLASSRFTNNGDFILKSSAAGTARIAAIPTTANLTTGNVIMERWLPYGTGIGSWYLMGTPFGGNNFTQLSDDFRVSGPASGFGAQGSDILPTNEPERYTIFRYDETQNNTRIDTVQKNGWLAPGNSNMIPGIGYRVFVNYYSNSIHKFDTKGTLNRNDFTFPALSRTVNTVCSPTTFNCDLNLNGWNLLSNPYPSAIDWDAAAGWTKPGNMNNAFYSWNSVANGYVAYNGAAATNLGVTVNAGPNPNVIPSSQGFFVKLLSGTTGTLVVKEGAKVSNTSGNYLRTATTASAAIRMRLKKEAQTDYQFDAMVKFEEGSSDAFDIHRDMDILSGPSYEFGFPNATGNLLLNSQSELGNETRIVPMQMDLKSARGSFAFEVLSQELPAGAVAYIRDNFLSEITEISQGSVFGFEANSDEAAMADRFELIINPAVFTSASGLSGGMGVNILPNPSRSGKGAVLSLAGITGNSAQVMVSDLSGKVLFVSDASLQGGRSELRLPAGLPGGVYLVKVKGENQIQTRRFVVE